MSDRAVIEAACRVCEQFHDCRGTCHGAPDGVPCPAFEWVTDRHGDIDPTTGDLVEPTQADGRGLAPKNTSTPFGKAPPPGRLSTTRDQGLGNRH